jgi:2-oxoglutarate ferredoxin oxidoreductase subunit alpha
VVREQMMEKRSRKLEAIARQVPLDEKLSTHGPGGARLTVITWGSNKGAVLDAFERMEVDGTQGRLIQVRLLWPFPGQEVARAAAGAQPLIVVECNHGGQLTRLLRDEAGLRPDHLVVKYSGRPFSGEALYRVLSTIRAGRGDPRMVVRNPDE